MMDERFKIYVEQLRDGHIEKLVESFSPEFLDVHEKDLVFTDPVNVSGEVYLADDMLVLHIDAQTFGLIPCRICTEPVRAEIAVHGYYHAEPLDEIKTGVFNFLDLLRDSILLEVPALVECHQGKCPQRLTMKKYLKEESAAGEENTEEGYRPFADLDLDFDKEKS